MSRSGRPIRKFNGGNMEEEKISVNLNTLAFPLHIGDGKMGLGLSKFELSTNLIYASLLTKECFDLSDQELLNLAKLSTRAAKCLYIAQNEAIKEAAERMKQMQEEKQKTE